MAQDSAPSDQASAAPNNFAATRWSLVLRAKEQSESALGLLCETYRRPLLIWLKGQQLRDFEPEDVLQGYLQDLLRRNFLRNVSQEKGKFRTFLLKCLKNYLRDLHERKNAAKRGAGQPVDSLDRRDEGGDTVYEPASNVASPDLEYDRAWAHAVLANALRRLGEECARQGHAALFAEVEPVLFYDDTALPYREIGLKLGNTEAAIKTAVSRIRARLRGLVRDEIMQTVANERDWNEEVRYLIRLFSKD